MRRKDPLIIGAGPAGCAAAITLAKGGARPLLVERNRETGDALCGGFISWRTKARLEGLGVSLSGHEINRLRVFSGGAMAEADLPEPALGVSRHIMDTALVAAALAAGAGLERGVTVRHKDDLLPATGPVFLATGKHDFKGCERPRTDKDPAIGLRVRLPASALVDRLVDDTIELHLFARGYAGIELQEDGSANICLAVRKSLLTAAGRDPAALLVHLAEAHPVFGERMAGFDARTPIDAIANIPYGWRQTSDPQGFYRLGDQCAVIPSLAGEGNGIALASGESAAKAWLSGQAAAEWQRGFARKALLPVGLATLLWKAGETRLGAGLAVPVLRILPQIATWIAQATRLTP